MKVSRIFLIPIVGILFSSCLNNTGIDQTTSQFTKDTTAILSYLTQNNIGATKYAAGVGIWFIVDSAAEGIRPTFKDSIKLKYTTRLLADNSVLSIFNAKTFPFGQHSTCNSGRVAHVSGGQQRKNIYTVKLHRQG